MFGFRNWATGAIRAGTAALILGLVAACSGSSDDGAPVPGAGESGEVVERSRTDQRDAERRERLRQQAVEEAEAGFTYFRYRMDVSGAQPKACFVFSDALDTETDYDPYIEFRPAFRPALSVAGRELCVSGLSFGDNRTAILKSGLPAADGRTLARGEEVPIDFADRPAYVGFRGSGVILPREDADGLPLETVNVDEVRLAVSYIPDRALAFKSITEGETSGQGNYSYLYGDENPGDVAEELWSGTMAVQRIDNAPVVTVFPLQDVIGELQPGAYFVEVTDTAPLSQRSGPPASARRWIVLTDLALTAYQGASGLDVTLRSLRDGQELPEARVQLIAYNNDVLAEARTDASGRVRFEAPILAGTGNGAPKLLLAFGAKGDTAVLDLTRAPVDLSEMQTGGRQTPGPVDAYLYTDRGIYRPGEAVHLTALLRNREGIAVPDRAGELVVYRPNGLKAETVRFTGAKIGGLKHTIDLPRDAQRGLWRADIMIDGMGRAGGLSFSVEDFVPQRIAVEITGDTATPVMAGETRELGIDARFLYGAPGAGLTVKTQARVEPDPAPFEAFGGFDFGRHDAVFNEQIIETEDRTADGAGKALVRLAPGQRGAESDRPLRLNTVVSVLEPGGRAVSESARIPYRPRDLYIGTKPGFDGRLSAGQRAVFQVAAINPAGEAVAAPLEWKLVAIDYHYDWYREGERWRWRRSRTVTTVNEGVAGAPEGGTTEIVVDGLDWGNHELIVTGPGGAIASRSFWVGWGGEVSGEGVEAPDRVQVSVTEAAVRVGRNAEITIVPPYDGEAEIIVATDRVLSIETRPVTRDGTRLTLPVTDAWGEGAYILVNVYTERDPVLAARPRRAVGVAYAPVDLGERTFTVAIDAPEIARPGREQMIEVTLEGGPREPVYMTLAAIDEGILRLTRFPSPDPVAYFFGKKALGVDLHDDYGRLLDPNLGLPAEVRTGGDQLGGEGLSVVPVKTVALYEGPIDVGRSRSAKVRLDLPDFNGELRLMAVVWSRNGLGAASRPMVVREQAPSDLILPRFLAPGDAAVVTASIDNVEMPQGEFEAVLTADGSVGVSAGEVSRALPQGQRADIPIRIEASETGISRLRLTVDGPDNFVADKQYLIETRSPFLPVTEVSSAQMAPGQSHALSPDLLDGLVPGTAQVTVSFAALPVDATALYTSLARYPYGCTEQTVSRALPLLYSDDLVAMGADGTLGESRQEVQMAVTRILNRQSADGAFGLWREGDRNASPWLGAYTTDFLVRAKANGHAVPDEALERAYGALAQVASGDAWRVYGYDTDVWPSRWHDDTEAKLMQRSAPHALYVLAKAGRADLSRLRYLHDRELGQIASPLARAHLGAALALMGDQARAISAFEAAIEALGYQNSGDYYQTPLRDTAGVLALAAEVELPQMTAALADQLGRDVPDPTELSTQEKAFLLAAVGTLSGGDAQSYGMAVTGLGRGNDNDRRYFLSAGQVTPEVTFTNTGSQPVFRSVMVTGAPSSAPPPASSRLGARKRLAALDGSRVDPGRLTQGDQIIVVLTLEPDERRTNPLIVADLLPAGLEIETILTPADGRRDNADSGAFAWIGPIAATKTAEARDDRFVAAIDVRDEVRTLAYVARAVTPGEFVMPGVVAEDMYRPDVFARTEVQRVVIAPADGGAGGTP